MTNIKIAAAARRAGLAGLMGAVAAATVIGFAGAAHADPPADPHHHGGRMYGNPTAAAPYCQKQTRDGDCALMAVADVVGQIKGRDQEPTEDEMLKRAKDTPSKVFPDQKIWQDATANGDIPVLLKTFGVDSENHRYDSIAEMAVDLDHGRKVIADVDPAIVYGLDNVKDTAGHSVVVTGIDTAADMVHVNDGTQDGCNKQVPVDLFKKALSARGNMAVRTK
jgi:Peptidase_C39 like family